MSDVVQPTAVTTQMQTGRPLRFAAGLRSVLRALLRDLACSWRHAVARREFNRLDAGTLRDLGISRSEFDSYWAETHGLAEQTRVRVIRRFRSRFGQ
jgi:uncharacterized protein YjiS (DUF1127 family)